MSHLPLDARAILQYLNDLGYRNISATQLKEFLKDLRKLIKYEDRIGVNTQQNDYYESLFRRTTASYRAKIDRENDNKQTNKRKSFESDKPATSRQAAAENRKILSERNYGEKSISSYDLDGSHKSRHTRNEASKKTEDVKYDTKSLTTLIEDTLTQVLREKYYQEFVEKGNNKTPIKSLVEEILKEKFTNLRQAYKENLNTSEPGSLRSIIENIVTQILKDKLSKIHKESLNSKDDNDSLKNLNEDLYQKLNISKEQTVTMQRAPLTHYNAKKTLDSQALVQRFLANKESDNKTQKIQSQKSKTNKENSTTSTLTTGYVKRLQKSPRKKPEWQDPRPNDKILDKPQRPLRPQSPTASSTERTGRSKCNSGVLVRRSASQGRYNKPKSDPVALYQYYKKEWDHFRKQIPGETSHNRLRWHVRQRLLDPE